MAIPMLKHTPPTEQADPAAELPDGDVEAILESPNDTQTSSSASAVSGGWWEVLGKKFGSKPDPSSRGQMEEDHPLVVHSTGSGQSNAPSCRTHARPMVPPCDSVWLV
uniref:HDC10998 n=1 Tax=Drosophila melanogaster TaxID=7227 RepID=Q6IKZ1_DROME|nr:TPA_inf: HDC10998 [Drosophila melanogaster]